MSETHRPLPPEIYMRRRVAALVIILVLVIGFIVVWASLRGGKNESAQVAQTQSPLVASSAPAPTSEATESLAATESAAASESLSPTVASTVSASGAAAASLKTTCELADLTISMTTDQPTYAADVQPTFYMTVVNPTAADCTINLDQEQLRFEVYSMGRNEPIWTDTDCTPSSQTGTQTFKAGQTRTFQATWSRQTSTRGTCNPRTDALAEAYFVHGVIGANYSPSQDFRLL